MKNRFKGNYLKVINKLIDLSDFPAVLCSIENKKDSFQFPKIIHCNKVFEKVFGEKLIKLVDKDFDALVNFDFPENEYIKFIKKIKDFKKISVKAKFKKFNIIKFFNINFHPLIFISTPETKYCLFDYIPISDLNTKVTESYNILDIKEIERYDGDENLGLNRILNNEQFLRETYEVVEEQINIQEMFERVTLRLCNYLKADRIIIQAYNDSKTIEYFSEHTNQDLLKITKNKEEELKYINIIDKLINKKNNPKNTLKVLSIRNVLKDSELLKIKDIIEKYKIQSNITIEDKVQNNIIVRIHIHQCYHKRDLQNDEIEMVNRIIERLSLIVEKNINLQKLQIANQKLQEKTKKLRESLLKERELRKVQTEFVAMVSHQFRTPLQIIEGARNIFRRKVAKLNISKEKQDEFEPTSNKIKNAIMRMNSLIDKTLDLSCIETNGGAAYNPEKINIKQTILNSINRFDNNSKNIKIKSSLINLPKDFIGDKKLLEHAFSNIIDNAIKYSEKNSVIEINTQINEEQFIISIKDYGIGIPLKNQEKIFEKFTRGHNSLTINGTGIGLFLVRRFIKRHNGSIRFNSEINKGTTFYISLPINYKEKVTS